MIDLIESDSVAPLSYMVSRMDELMDGRAKIKMVVQSNVYVHSTNHIYINIYVYIYIHLHAHKKGQEERVRDIRSHWLNAALKAECIRHLTTSISLAPTLPNALGNHC